MHRDRDPHCTVPAGAGLPTMPAPAARAPAVLHRRERSVTPGRAVTPLAPPSPSLSLSHNLIIFTNLKRASLSFTNDLNDSDSKHASGHHEASVTRTRPGPESSASLIKDRSSEPPVAALASRPLPEEGMRWCQRGSHGAST